ncbi:MAG: pilus assembly protein PilM [Acidimicrobiaceae bacterium]|nr:pilus assembly protein PilM [Acidimicrobiaceae bacterium]
MNRGPFVCLDFGLDRLCAIEVSEGRVVRWAVQRLLPGTVRGGDPDNPSALADGIRWALQRAGITAKRARIAVSDDAAVVRVVEMPRMPTRHLPGALRYLSEQQTPFPAGQASLAWDVVDREATSQHVYLAAAWKDVVNRLATAARAAGLEPVIIEPHSLAVGRALGQREALVVDATEGRARLLHLNPTQAPLTDETELPPNGEWEALNRMLERALRNQRCSLPLLFAGELESMADSPNVSSLNMRAEPASHALNGQGPTRPPGMPSGSLLGPLGLAMPGGRSNLTFGYPQVNLLAVGRDRRMKVIRILPSRANRRLVTAGAAAGALVLWSVAGAAMAMVLGWHPHFPLGP